MGQKNLVRQMCSEDFPVKSKHRQRDSGRGIIIIVIFNKGLFTSVVKNDIKVFVAIL